MCFLAYFFTYAFVLFSGCCCFFFSWMPDDDDDDESEGTCEDTDEAQASSGPLKNHSRSNHHIFFQDGYGTFQ